MPTPFLSSEEYDERAHQLYNEGQYGEALHFFEAAVQQTGESAEAIACVGYAKHRLSDDEGSIASLRKALQLDADHSEARIYLANLLYDRGEFEGALYHFERTQPEDHWDELGIWRLIELKRAVYKLDENDAELRPWDERLAELSEGLDDIDELLMELEPSKSGLQKGDDPEMARNQLELFGSLLTGLVERKEEEYHHIVSSDGSAYRGSWDEIVTSMRDADAEVAGHTVEEYMQRTA